MLGKEKGLGLVSETTVNIRVKTVIRSTASDIIPPGLDCGLFFNQLIFELGDAFLEFLDTRTGVL